MLQRRIVENKSVEVAGFDCKHSSSYGFKRHNYSNALHNVFVKKTPSILVDPKFIEYLSIWQSIEKGTEKGIMGRLRYKMSAAQKENFRSLSSFVALKLNEVNENKWAQMIRGMDEGILAYSDVRLGKLIFNKKSLIPINNRRDEIMAQNVTYLLTHEYAHKKVILIGATYHFIRNNAFIDPISIQGISINNSTIMGNLLYPGFKDELYTIGFTAYKGEHGYVASGKKGKKVVSPPVNSLEHQLAAKNYRKAFVSLKNTGTDPFWHQKPVVRLFHHQLNACSNDWDKILDGIYFIQTMKPATY
jgi:erythromycin esterase-like protein